MGDDARDVKVRLSVDDATKAGLQSAEKEMDGYLSRLAQKAKIIQRESRESGESSLDRLLSGGPAGLAKLGLGALGVGMQGMVVEMVGQSLKGGTDKMLEIVNRGREGNLDGGSLVDQMLGEVPIVGDFWGAGRNIHEMMTGEEFEQKREEKINQLDDQVQEGRNNLFEAMIESRRRMQEEVMGSKAAAAIAQEWRVPDQQARDAVSESMRRAKDEAKDAIDANNKAVDKANEKLRSALNERIKTLGESASSPILRQDAGFESFAPTQAGGESQDDLSADLAAAMKERDDLEKTIAKEKADFAAGTNEKLANQLAEGQAKLDELNERFEHDRQESLRSNQNQILDMTAKFQADKLRLEGQGLDAEMTLINAGAEKQRESIAHDLIQDLKAHAGDIPYSLSRISQAATESGLVTADQQLQTIIAKRNADTQARAVRDSMTDLVGSVLNNAMSIPGVQDSAEARQLQYKLSQEAMIRSWREQIDDIARGPQGAAEAANLAQLRPLIDEYQKDALSPSAIQQSSFKQQPLRLTGYEEYGEGYTGLAENARAQDLDSQVRDRNSGDIKQLLGKIVDVLNTIQKQGQPGAVNGSNLPSLFGGY